MKLFRSFTLALAVTASTAALGEAVKSSMVAANGVTLTVYSDDFAKRYEYTAPTVTIKDGYVLVASVKNGNSVVPPYLTGAFNYTGEWRRYGSAIFKGGAPAKFIEAGRDVGRCFSSRYSAPSCSLSESFRIELTPAEIKAHAEAGVLAIQVRAADASTAIIEIPTPYFEALSTTVK